MTRVASVKGMKVPKNIWGRINIREIPVAAPGDLAIVAVIKPSPTEHSDKNSIKINAIITPKTSTFGRKPIKRDNRNTIASWKTAINKFVMI